MKEINPFFSVVIPTYNRSAKIKKTIDSLIKQSFKEFEVIVVDNGSDDDTREVIESYHDMRLKYIYQEGSGSPANPRNTGIKNAKSDWICFLDSDDWWYEEKLEVFHDYIVKNKNVDVLYHGMDLVNLSSGENVGVCSMKEIAKPIYTTFLEKACFGGVIANSSVAVRKEHLFEIGLIEESKLVMTFEDFSTWVSISKLTDEFVFIPKVMGALGVGGDNLTSYNLLWAKNFEDWFSREIESSFSFSPSQRQVMYSNIHFKYARSYHMGGQFREARKSYLEIAKAPISIVSRVKSLCACVLCLFKVKL